ncbi:coiled-coil domain-containing protein 82 [Hyperolius riggenbachi]|uniref:coiled-coil domain-containing protein 82 n=1 Tax=Hyperolius riggenbachi TaxID=752182 RepID=UPI0035A337E5
MASVSRTYQTRHKRKSSETPPKSRVDWKRTKVDTVSHILDSDETTTSEEEEEESDSEDSGSSSTTQGEDQQPSQEPADDVEDNIKTPRRKSRSAMIGSSDSSSDSDEPGTKVGAKRCRVIDEDEEALNKPPVDEETKAQLKKQKRKENLKMLAERRRSRNQRTSQASDKGSGSGEDTPLSGVETLAEEEDDMQDFIVDDEEEAEEDEEGNRSARYQDLFLKHNLSQFASNDLYSHLQKVIKAFLINIADNTFLVTLYDRVREKRYAKDMLKSLNYLDERIIAPRLEKLTTSCRWKKRYQERVDCYPQILVRRIKAEEQSCDACELFRYCSFTVTLSGLAYDIETLENDNFLPEDKQYLVVGSTCAARTKVYHRIKHYKYQLYHRCIPYLTESKDLTAKEMVAMALTKMEEEEFIKEEVRYLERIVNEADTFREEDAESLIS